MFTIKAPNIIVIDGEYEQLYYSKFLIKVDDKYYYVGFFTEDIRPFGKEFINDKNRKLNNDYENRNGIKITYWPGIAFTKSQKTAICAAVVKYLGGINNIHPADFKRAFGKYYNDI